MFESLTFSLLNIKKKKLLYYIYNLNANGESGRGR